MAVHGNFMDFHRYFIGNSHVNLSDSARMFHLFPEYTVRLTAAKMSK